MSSTHVTTLRVLENNIVTTVNLAKRGVVVDSILCGLCGVKEETTSHLFFECKIVWLVWNLYYAWLWLKSVDHIASVLHFLHFKFIGAPTSVNLGFENVWITLVNESWRHRNKHIFKGEVVDHSKIFSLTQLKDLVLGYSKVPSAYFFFLDWCLDPLACIFF